MKIKTRFISPTDSRGAKIKASCALGSKWIAYPYELNHTARHEAAFNALVEKLEETIDVRTIEFVHEIV